MSESETQIAVESHSSAPLVEPSTNGNENSKSQKAGAKRRGKKKSKRAKSGKRAATRRPVGAAKPYPTATFENVLSLSQTIFEHAGASREMKRVTIFELLGRASESGPGRSLVINSNRYGLTVGGAAAEVLRLSDEAYAILGPATDARVAIRTRYALAIERIDPFNTLYQRFKGGTLPAHQVMNDALEGVEPDDRQECVEIFIGNLNYIGLLIVVGGAQRILDIDKDVEAVSSRAAGQEIAELVEATETPVQTDFDSTCFFMAPIGNEGEEKRKHSDMVLSTLVTPALKQFNLNVVRADQIAKPGMISKQILEFIIKSKLVVVDLSFHNPNVFYELAIRHLLGKSTVHIVKKSDGLPFDIGNFRTIELEDMGYDFVANIETHKVKIANYVREALDGSSSADNPILTFFPDLRVSLSSA